MLEPPFQAQKGKKDDAKDSKRIGDLFRTGLVKSGFIPAKDIRILRELTRYRYKLTSMKNSEKNRFQNAFTICNVALDSVVSDVFGKSATAITVISKIGVDMTQFGSSNAIYSMPPPGKSGILLICSRLICPSISKSGSFKRL